MASLAISGAVAAVGCTGQRAGDPEDPREQDAPAGTESPVGDGNGNDDQGPLIISAQSWMMDKLSLSLAADRFREEAGVDVEIVEYPDNQSLANFALLWSQGSADQDIVFVDGTASAVQFVARDLLVDINETDFFTGHAAKENFVGESLSFGEYDGVQFAVPVGLETYGLNINKQFFIDAGLISEESESVDVPESWQDLYDLADQLTERDGDRVTRPGMTLQWGPNALYTLLATQQSLRGSFYQDDGTTIAFDTPELRETLELWKRGADDGLFSKDTFTNKDAGRNNFNAAQLPILFESQSRSPEAISEFDISTADLLDIPGAAQNGSVGFAAGMIIPQASTKQELAVRFLREAMMSDVQVEGGAVWGKLPVLQEHLAAIDAPWRETIEASLSNSVSVPLTPAMAELQTVTAQQLQMYLDGSSSLDEFLAEMEARAAEV